MLARCFQRTEGDCKLKRNKRKSCLLRVSFYKPTLSSSFSSLVVDLASMEQLSLSSPSPAPTYRISFNPPDGPTKWLHLPPFDRWDSGGFYSCSPVLTWAQREPGRMETRAAILGSSRYWEADVLGAARKLSLIEALAFIYPIFVPNPCTSILHGWGKWYYVYFFFLIF